MVVLHNTTNNSHDRSTSPENDLIAGALLHNVVLVIDHATIVTASAVIQNARIGICDGKISMVSNRIFTGCSSSALSQMSNTTVIDAHHGYVTPGGLDVLPSHGRDDEISSALISGGDDNCY